MWSKIQSLQAVQSYGLLFAYKNHDRRVSASKVRKYLHN